MDNKIPPLDYIESQGTRWVAQDLRYLLTLKPADLKAELQRLLGAPETTPEPDSKEN